MSESLRSLGLLDGLLFCLLLGGLGLAVAARFNPSSGLRRVAQGISALAFSLMLAGPLLLGNPGGWGLLSLGAGILGLRALQLARQGAERWVLPGALLLGVVLRLTEPLKEGGAIEGFTPLMLGLPWALGLAELLLAGLLVMEEGLPASGRWLDLKGALLDCLRRAFLGLALALLGQALSSVRLDAGATAPLGVLLLLVGGLLHQQRIKTWPRGLFLAGVCLAALLGLVMALLLSSFPAFGVSA